MATPAPDPKHVTNVPGYTSPSGLPLDSPDGYDTIKLAVPLQEMTAAKTTVETSLNSILDSLVTIEQTLAELRLGWAGKTADQARELFDQWNACMKELVGTKTKEKPDGTEGVFQRLMIALGSAVSNYDHAEDFIVTKLFGPLTTAIGSPATGSGDPGAYNPAPTSPAPDKTNTVIAEVF
ncbi:WXG100 family type VII secretion target [Kitasatospora sp. NPDC018619]|uniref:WXG100 family type VII secretion target n=1 Tax=unclassified Kitasatospora TaxID=2633591 RepID=UPI003792006C